MVMDIVLLVGRILFALIFINSGIAHFTKNAAMTGYAQYKKVPLAKLSVYVSGVMILLGGVYIALGFYADLGALLLAAFLIPAAVIFDAFWKETDAAAEANSNNRILQESIYGWCCINHLCTSTQRRRFWPKCRNTTFLG
jgi:uncharacterized membrane protein YphA (DoxX/SURF4 family)